MADKVLAMALSSLLLAAGTRQRPLWLEVGGSFVAVDTLVHNFLHRTALQRLSADHPYGAKCYQPGGCAGIFGILAAYIDARQFNPAFPAAFPRSYRARSGGIAPETAWTSAMVIASMTTRVATMLTANCFDAVIA